MAAKKPKQFFIFIFLVVLVLVGYKSYRAIYPSDYRMVVLKDGEVWHNSLEVATDTLYYYIHAVSYTRKETRKGNWITTANFTVKGASNNLLRNFNVPSDKIKYVYSPELFAKYKTSTPMMCMWLKRDGNSIDTLRVGITAIDQKSYIGSSMVFEYDRYGRFIEH